MKLNITLGDDGLYHARVFAKPDEEGRRPSKRISGYSKKEVEAKAATFIVEMSANPNNYRMTLAEAAEKYLEYLKTKKKPISPSTEKTYRGYIRQNFKALHNTAIVDITEDTLQKEIYKLESVNTPKTIRNVVNFYVPCIHHFRRGFNPDLDLPDAETPDIPIPDMNELKEKIAGIKNKRLLIPVLLAAYCGLRRSEIAAIDLGKDIDYDVLVQAGDASEIRVCYIHINKAVVRGVENYVEKGTKTKAGERVVIGPAWLNDTLKDARDDPDYIPYPPHKISSRFAEWAEREGINCSFHGLRHFYASVGDSLGIPDLYMMEMMGHSTPYMLERYKEIMASKRIEVNHTMLNYLQSNSPFAPQIAPSEIVNED